MPQAEANTAPPLSNSPPLAETARMAIDEQLAALAARKAELLEALPRVKCTNSDEAGKCADMVKAIKKLVGKADSIRKDEKEQYAEAGKAVDAAAKGFSAALIDAEIQIRGLLDGFARAERERAAAEQRRIEAEQRLERERIAAQEAKDRAAAAEAGASIPEPAPAPAEPERRPERATPAPVASGDYGASAHSRKVTIVTVEDPYALPLSILTAPDVTEAIIKVAKRMRTANPDMVIHGIAITEDTKVMIR